MYYPNHIEDICYEEEHINQVVEEIKANFAHYFNMYLETEDGKKISEKEFEELAKKLGCTKTAKTAKGTDKGKAFKNIIVEVIKLPIRYLFI